MWTNTGHPLISLKLEMLEACCREVELFWAVAYCYYCCLLTCTGNPVLLQKYYILPYAKYSSLSLSCVYVVSYIVSGSVVLSFKLLYIRMLPNSDPKQFGKHMWHLGTTVSLRKKPPQCVYVAYMAVSCCKYVVDN